MSRRRDARRAFTGLVLLLALVAGCGPAEPEGGPTEPERRPTQEATAVEGRAPAPGTTGSVTVTATSVVVGDPQALVRVHVYQDLSCPHCQTLHALMADDVAAWAQGEDVAVEFTVVDYLGARTTHGFSTRGAALLALVADEHPEAWPAVQEALFELQPTSTTQEVPDTDLLGAARDAGADVEDGDLTHLAAYAGWVERATAQAAAAGVGYIPQVWVDGELVEGATHEETVALLRQAVAD